MSDDQDGRPKILIMHLGEQDTTRVQRACINSGNSPVLYKPINELGDYSPLIAKKVVDTREPDFDKLVVHVPNDADVNVATNIIEVIQPLVESKLTVLCTGTPGHSAPLGIHFHCKNMRIIDAETTTALGPDFLSITPSLPEPEAGQRDWASFLAGSGNNSAELTTGFER